MSKKKNYFLKLKKEWEDNIFPVMMKSESFIEIFSKKMTKELWGLLMVESGHLARYNPQLQAYATMYFKGRDEIVVRKFLTHAISEIGHDELAYNDADICGIPINQNRESKPRYSTIALRSLPLYLIQFENPISYLGYLFILEFLPTTISSDLLDVLKKSNIPLEATSFFQDHSSIDIHHNKFMEGYVDLLIKNDNDYEMVVGAMNQTSYLYINMISDVVGSYKENSIKK